MDVLKAQAAHLIMAAIVIGAVCALAATGAITGVEALTIVGTVGGVSLGGATASLSNSSTPTTPSVTVPLSVDAHASTSPSSTTTVPSTTPIKPVPVQPAASS